MRALMVCCVVGVVLVSCGGSDGGEATESVEPNPTVTAAAPTTVAGPPISELIAAEWTEFCTSGELYATPTEVWAEHRGEIEAALSGADAAATEEGAAFLELFDVAIERRESLADAIDDALATTTVADCSDGNCEVLIGESEGVYVVNWVAGGGGLLEVGTELSDYSDALADLEARSLSLGLAECELFLVEEEPASG